MVDYAQTTASLQEKLEQVIPAQGRRKAQHVGVTLDWRDEETAAYRETLAMTCKPVLPDNAAAVCMFTDVTLTGHALVLTQVSRWQEELPVEEQQHGLLVCRGGLFKGSATELVHR
ncbi:hypothetical protein PI125_g15533 [Phytophthora idaei]|nr:hypothetical protein PI125_g15533 [Phytophthora idaei]